VLRLLHRELAAAEEMWRRRCSRNLIHLATGFKIDVFPVSSHALGAQQLKRRRVEESAILGGPAATFPVISREDTILVKLAGTATEVNRRSANGTICAVLSGSRETGWTSSTCADGPLSLGSLTCSAGS